MQTTKAIFLLVVIHLCFFTGLYGNAANTGTLIVTYQTDQQGERLDRIRFWVQDNNFKQRLYPKGNMYVDDPVSKARRVVIENLPAGQYSISFLVPNTDGYFAEAPVRKITIDPEAVVKLIQVIKPQAHVSEPIVVSNIIAEPPEKMETPIHGALIVSYSADRDLDKIFFRIVDEHGLNQRHPHQDDFISAAENGGKVVVLTEMKPGKYKIVFIKGTEKLSEEDVVVKPGTASTVFYGQWTPMDAHGQPWTPMDIYGL